MAVRKLRDIDGSGGITLPKDDLRRDGMVDDDGEIKSTHVAIDRIADGEYRVRKLDSDDY